MGADFIYTAVRIDRPAEEWLAAVNAATDLQLAELADEASGHYWWDDEQTDPEALRSELAAAITVAYDVNHRETHWFTPLPFTEKTFCLTGGMSWGEPPTEAFLPLQLLARFQELCDEWGSDEPR